MFGCKPVMYENIERVRADEEKGKDKGPYDHLFFKGVKHYKFMPEAIIKTTSWNGKRDLNF